MARGHVTCLDCEVLSVTKNILFPVHAKNVLLCNREWQAHSACAISIGNHMNSSAI